MTVIFAHIGFAPCRRLKTAVAAGAWPAARRALATICRLIGIKLIPGLAVVAVTSGGRHLV